MEILLPRPRSAPRSRALPLAAALCVPALAVWVVVGLDLTGLWREGAEFLTTVPEWAQGVVAVGGPLLGAVVASVDYARRARRAADRRPLALSTVAAALAVVAAAAAFFRGL